MALQGEIETVSAKHLKSHPRQYEADISPARIDVTFISVEQVWSQLTCDGFCKMLNFSHISICKYRSLSGRVICEDHIAYYRALVVTGGVAQW